MHRGSKYGTCLTPLGQFQTLGGGGVGDSGTSREHWTVSRGSPDSEPLHLSDRGWLSGWN